MKLRLSLLLGATLLVLGTVAAACDGDGGGGGDGSSSTDGSRNDSAYSLIKQPYSDSSAYESFEDYQRRTGCGDEECTFFLPEPTPIESVFPRLSGNWDAVGGSYRGYLHFKFLGTNEDGDEDVYDFFDYNTSQGVPVLLSEGKLTVDSDGNGYMEGAGGNPCPHGYGGGVTFSSSDQFTGDLTCFSVTGEVAGGDVTIRYARRR